ncbi:hypothetical protein AAMO2058_001147300 [Amorphochlora amoebiformis]
MAAFFHKSSHCKNWLLSRREILESNSEDVLASSQREVKQLRMYFVELLHIFGRKLKLRQRVIATSVVYFKRFYVTRSFGEYDPRICAPTMLFIAGKVEETYVNARSFAMWAKDKDLGDLYKGSELTIESILKFELFAVEALKFELIVFHPYRPLTMILETGRKQKLLPLAWSIANDSYRTDTCLQYAPAKIAIAIIHLTLVTTEATQSELDGFLEKVSTSSKQSIEIEDILEISGTLIDLYRYYDQIGKNKHMKPADVIKSLTKLRDSHDSKFKTNHLNNSDSTTLESKGTQIPTSSRYRTSSTSASMNLEEKKLPRP